MPNQTSLATPRPPARVTDAVPVAVASVAAENDTIPAEDIAIASVSDAEPIVPASAIESPVANKSPVLELNVRLVPDFGPRSPVTAVTNKGKHVVSEDSSATVIAVGVHNPRFDLEIFLRTPPSSTRTKSASPELVVVVAESEFPVVITVPVTFGKVIVRSAVGSVTISVVSCASAVAPSKEIEAPKALAAEMPSTSVTNLLNSILNSSRLLLGIIALDVMAIILYPPILSEGF